MSTDERRCGATDAEVRKAVTDGGPDSDRKTWEAVGREALHESLYQRFGALEGAQHDLEEKLVGGDEITAEDLLAWRMAFYELERIVEGRMAEAVDGAEPYERAFDHITFGRIDAALEEYGYGRGEGK